MARSRRFSTIGGVVLVVLAVAGFAGWWFLIRDDAPEEASIDEASRTLDDESGGSASGGSLEGTWTVDTSIGGFDYDAEDFSGTWAGYRFDEELGGIGANTAVGRTPGVSGTMTIEGDQVTAVDIEVDMTRLESDEDRRDNAIRGRGLETDRFPTGTFTLTEPVDLPVGVADGERVEATVAGELTLHGVTRPATVDVEAELRGDNAVIVGQAPVAMSDFDIEPPTNAFVLSVDEEGTFEFQIFFSRQ
ncbi:MAG TPA: YceI family protein [Acidimicrobiales bacterium]